MKAGGHYPDFITYWFIFGYNEVMKKIVRVHNVWHIYPTCRIIYFSSKDIGTRDHQFFYIFSQMTVWVANDSNPHPLAQCELANMLTIGPQNDWNHTECVTSKVKFNKLCFLSFISFTFHIHISRNVNPKNPYNLPNSFFLTLLLSCCFHWCAES